jgi:hypothetical protein
MARFSGDPLKNPLTGNEFIPATDPGTGNDVSMTPSIITQFVATNMDVANGSSNGLIDAASYAKLLALPSNAVLSSQLSELSQVALPIFIAAPANGTSVIYQHGLSIPWTVQTMTLFTSAGSTNVQFQINGTPVTFGPFGTTNPATTSPETNISTGATNRVIHPGDQVGIAISGTTGNAANLAISIYATASL